MSKSQGNVVDPLEIMQEYGADILRLWTMTSDFAEDIRIGKDSLKQTADLYRRIRNTLRFLLGALDGFTKEEAVDLGKIKELPELEQLMLHKVYETDQKVRALIADFEFMKLTKLLHDFCNDDLSAFYFDIRKDRLYCDDPASFERRATRNVMAVIFNSLTAWLAPILVFTAEEAWQHRPAAAFENAESVHLRTLPDVPKNWKNEELVEKWKVIRFQRESVLLSLEKSRKEKFIGSSLDANVFCEIHQNYKFSFENISNEVWAEICIVSDAQIKFENADDLLGQTSSFYIEKAEDKGAKKCGRCWKVLPEVGTQKDHPALCNRCADVVRQQKKAAA